MISRLPLLAFIVGSLLCLVELSAQELYVEPLKHAAVTKNAIYAAKLTTSGGLLALAGLDKSIKIIDPATLREKYNLTGRSSRILTLAFTADGKYLVSGGGSGLLSFWSIADRDIIERVSGTRERSWSSLNRYRCRRQDCQRRRRWGNKAVGNGFGRPSR